jgi:hypothetical protein
MNRWHAHPDDFTDEPWSSVAIHALAGAFVVVILALVLLAWTSVPS